FVRAADRRGRNESGRPQHWQVVAECRRRLDLPSAADPRRDCVAIVALARFGHDIHLGQHDAPLELGHGEFLAANSVRVYRPGNRVNDERRSPGSPAYFSPRHLRFRRVDRNHLYHRHLCCAFAASRGRRRYQERRVSSHHFGFHAAENRIRRRAGGDAGFGGKRGRSGQHGCRRFARAVRRGAGPVSSRSLRKNSSEVENAVRRNFSPSCCFGVILLATQINETANSASQILVDATTIVYFISLMYMCAAAIRLAYLKDRETTPGAVLIPGGVLGVWIASLLGIFVVLGGIALSFIPPAESANKFLFVAK